MTINEAEEKSLPCLRLPHWDEGVYMQVNFTPQGMYDSFARIFSRAVPKGVPVILDLFRDEWNDWEEYQGEMYGQL